MYKLFVLFLLISGTYFSEGSTTIQCENLEYADRKLDFFQYSDPIAKESEFVFSLEFDKNGKCTSSTDNKTTNFVFCDFGIYRGMLFLEPGKTIKIQLPPLREKSFADKKNPYFSPVAFWFTSENSKQLNNKISAFSQKLNSLTDKYFNQLYFRQSKEIYDSLVFLLDKEFSGIQSEAFIFHKKMKLKTIETEVFRQKPEQFSSLFSDVAQQFWLFPAFLELFDNAFNGQLSFEAKSVKGEKIRAAVNHSNITFLKEFVKNKYKISGEIVDLVILKLLHDAFYSGYFSKNSILKMVGSELFTNNSNKLIQKSALLITAKLTFLQKGTVAPPICLNTVEGGQFCTNQTSDKFKYIVFADTEMIVCREQLKYLVKIEQRFQKYLDIFIVLRKTDPVEMKKFLSENNIAGIKLIDENNEFSKKYKVKSFPQCYLLDENHKVEFVSAKAPLDGFEQQFGNFLQHKLFERQRNQTR
ncbi:MAG: redoxin domain-containing protein [Draconibacterium sp.]|nr:redoxin domain-containing protein [Draconibacterium sp.]